MFQYGDSLYVTDWQVLVIERIQKTTGLHRKTVHSNVGHLMDVKVVSRDYQLGAFPHFSHLTLFLSYITVAFCVCFYQEITRVASAMAAAVTSVSCVPLTRTCAHARMVPPTCHAPKNLDSMETLLMSESSQLPFLYFQADSSTFNFVKITCRYY